LALFGILEKEKQNFISGRLPFLLSSLGPTGPRLSTRSLLLSSARLSPSAQPGPARPTRTCLTASPDKRGLARHTPPSLPDGDHAGALHRRALWRNQEHHRTPRFLADLTIPTIEPARARTEHDHDHGGHGGGPPGGAEVKTLLQQGNDKNEASFTLRSSPQTPCCT
jgi:hypothetical protein